jgi:DNA mismatch repair protein MutS
MKILEWEGKIIFKHEIEKGIADHSYGIHVAALAGLPQQVIDRAESVLKDLKSTNFTPIIVPSPPPEPKSFLEDKLKNINIDNISPKEALDMLYTLQNNFKSDRG